MDSYQPYIWQEPLADYQEFKPDQRLAHSIDCYWVSYAGLLPKPARVIPDLCADLILNFDQDRQFISLHFSGPNTAYFITSSQPQHYTVGIRFF